VRRLLYTTDAIESLNYQLREVTKARGHFPGDDAVVKLLWLAIINIEDKRARKRAARRRETGKRSDQPARLIEGQRVMGLARSTQRARRRLPRTDQVKAENSPNLKDLYTPEVTSSEPDTRSRCSRAADCRRVPIGRDVVVAAHGCEVVDRVTASHERISITRHGHREAVVIAADDLDALEDTLDILSDPVAVREIAEARQAAARGEGLDLAAIRRRYLGHGA
jgi:prevent-host-death family protein